MRSIRSKLTYANVIATLALFIAIGGASAFAASKLAKNSVGTKQIKNSAVTAAKIKKGTITGTQINLAKLGTVPSATAASTANTATTAGTANALAAMEPTRFVGASGQPPFLDGSSNVPGGGGLKFQEVGFYKDHEGVVHLTGAAKVGKESNPVAGLLFTLPPGDRPTSGDIEAFRGLEEKTIIFIFGSNVTAAGHDLSGDVFTTTPSEKTELLAGITFRAES
jgi:hypothetical protein